MSNNYFDDLTERVDQVAVARLDMGHNENVVEKWGAGIKQHISHTRVFAESYAPELSVDNAEIARLEQALKDTRDELEVYRLASETAVYEASQFDRGLFLSGDRGVEDVMRRVLEALKVARSEATQAARVLKTVADMIGYCL